MIKPVYLVWDNEAKRYVYNTTRDQGIYSSLAVELFKRADLEEAYFEGYYDAKYEEEHPEGNWLTISQSVEQLIEHDGKPYKEW